MTTDLYIKNPQISVDVDREKAAVYGVTVDQVRQELYNAFGTRQVATIYTPANDYQVILESMPDFRAGPDDLNALHLKTSNGTLVPLTAVTHFVPHGRPAPDQPSGPAASGDDFVQPRPGHVAWPGDRRDPEARA